MHGGKPVSVCPVAAGPGPQKVPIIVDLVIVIAIGPCCQAPAPESEDVGTLPAPLGFVNGCHHKWDRLESRRQPLTARVPPSVCLGSKPTQPRTRRSGLPNQPDPLGPLAGQAASAPVCSLQGKHVFSQPFPSWPTFVSLAASKGCGGGHSNRQPPAFTWTSGAREVAAGIGGYVAGRQ